MTTIADTALDRMLLAKEAARQIGLLGDTQKSALLLAIAHAIEANTDEIVAANADDLARGEQNGLSAGLLDRLRLDATRVAALASAVRDVASLPDPVGRVLDDRTLPTGVHLQKVAVPFGVVGSIYEARPNVTVDIASLALRAGNAVVLRGGTAAQASNGALVRIMRGALAEQGLDPEAIQTVDDFGRDGARARGCRGAAPASCRRRSSRLRCDDPRR